MSEDERNEQIEKATEDEWARDAGLTKDWVDGFWEGAIWADSNPKKVEPLSFDEHHAQKMREALDRTQRALEKAMEYLNSRPCDCRYSPPHLKSCASDYRKEIEAIERGEG